ncbi:MAG: hypothetical protein ACKV1O_04630 [Saprospiraceae bacterium]
MNIYAVTFFLFFGSPIFMGRFLENPCGVMIPRGKDGDWGTGAIFIPDGFQTRVYQNNSGVLFGMLVKKGESLNLTDKNGRKMEISFDDLEWIGYSGNSLVKVKKWENAAYLKIMWKSFKEGLYLKKEEIELSGAKYFTYKDYLFGKDLPQPILDSKKWAKIGVNLNKNCVNFRKSPTLVSEKIMCILGHDWCKECTIINILGFDGNWANVEVSIVMNDPDGSECDYIVKNKHIGWVKAVDETGFPNIWFSVSSY